MAKRLSEMTPAERSEHLDRLLEKQRRHEERERTRRENESAAVEEPKVEVQLSGLTARQWKDFWLAKREAL